MKKCHPPPGRARAEGEEVSKKPPIFRIKTLSRPVPDRKTNELLAIGFANDAEAYIGAAQQLEDFRSFGPRYFLSVTLSNCF
jgi:hypothetical protein